MSISSANLLTCDRVGQRFGGLVALDDVKLSVMDGEIHALVGPNGAGKTTLLNILGGVHPPTTGSIKFCGTPIERMTAIRRAHLGIRRTFQNLRLFPDMTGLETVLVGRHLQTRGGIIAALLQTRATRESERAERAQALEALDTVGLAHAANTPACSLSYGHKRLLEIARAIVSRPRLLLLDEPAAGLTRSEAKNLVGLIHRIRAAGATIVLVEHHMDVVRQSCERATVLHHGRNIAAGEVETVLRNPAVVSAYFGKSTIMAHS